MSGEAYVKGHIKEYMSPAATAKARRGVGFSPRETLVFSLWLGFRQASDTFGQGHMLKHELQRGRVG